MSSNGSVHMKHGMFVIEYIIIQMNDCGYINLHKELLSS